MGEKFSLNDYFDLLKIKNYKIIGSYTNPNREFYSDIDLEEVLYDTSVREFATKLQGIIRDIDKRSDVFFLDFKAGNFGGQPVKWLPSEILSGHRYIDNIRYSLTRALTDHSIVKLDVLLLSDNLLIPVTINYWLYERIINKSTFTADLYLYAQYLREKGYIMEYIKKMLLYYRQIGNKKKEKTLINLLNSEFGLVYKYISILDSILTLLKSPIKGYHIKDIKSNFKKIYDDLPANIRHFALPLLHIVNKPMLVDTIPKVIHSLEEYIEENVKIDSV